MRDIEPGSALFRGLGWRLGVASALPGLALLALSAAWLSGAFNSAA